MIPRRDKRKRQLCFVLFGTIIYSRITAVKENYISLIVYATSVTSKISYSFKMNYKLVITFIALLLNVRKISANSKTIIENFVTLASDVQDFYKSSSIVLVFDKYSRGEFNYIIYKYCN